MKYFIFPGFGVLALVLFIGIGRKATKEAEIIPTVPIVRNIEAVAALGQLTPSSEIRMLAAPVSGFGGTPRIKKLLIEEGDEILKGQVLAVFDSQSRILADIDIAKAHLYTINQKIVSQEREVSRFKKLVSKGASPQILFDEKNDYLLELLGKKKELIAELKGFEVDLLDSKLSSPIDGIVLKINVREGERPGNDGVLHVGSIHQMEAVIEVYESDIDRVSVGQDVSLISENGGFSGTLTGQVRKISPQISQRRVLATDPTGDADARVVEVRIKLHPNSSEKVKSFTGMKVIARFEPK